VVTGIASKGSLECGSSYHIKLYCKKNCEGGLYAVMIALALLPLSFQVAAGVSPHKGIASWLVQFLTPEVEQERGFEKRKGPGTVCWFYVR
jgi:hypothetical protein